MKTIAFDFDGVLHAYSKGWKDGSIYDDLVPGIMNLMCELHKKGYAMFILSTRNSKQIEKFFKTKFAFEIEVRPPSGAGDDGAYVTQWETPFEFKAIPFYWHWFFKFWNKTSVVGITNRKLPAMVYIDDRALLFDGKVDGLLEKIENFETWTNNKSSTDE